MTSVTNPVEMAVDLTDVEFRGGALNRDRPFNASRHSVRSSKSVVSTNPDLNVSPTTLNNLFSCKEGAVKAALEQCKAEVVNSELDGVVQGSWLITEIDHWDMEREKVVLLTTNSLVIVAYDFILRKVHDFRRIILTLIKSIEVGDLVYPPASVMKARREGGVRIHWGSEAPTFVQRWNPFFTDVGFVTLCHHLVAYKRDESETVTYNVSDLTESLIDALHKHGITINIVNDPIIIESYASFASMVFNQSHLGFNMSRGGLNF